MTLRVYFFCLVAQNKKSWITGHLRILSFCSRSSDMERTATRSPFFDSCQLKFQLGCGRKVKTLVSSYDVNRFQQKKCDSIFAEATQIARGSSSSGAAQDLFIEQGGEPCSRRRVTVNLFRKSTSTSLSMLPISASRS